MKNVIRTIWLALSFFNQLVNENLFSADSVCKSWCTYDLVKYYVKKYIHFFFLQGGPGVICIWDDRNFEKPVSSLLHEWLRCWIFLEWTPIWENRDDSWKSSQILGLLELKFDPWEATVKITVNQDICKLCNYKDS